LLLRFSVSLPAASAPKRLGIRATCPGMPGRRGFSDSIFSFSAGFSCPNRCRRRAQDGVKAMDHASAPLADGLSEPESKHLAPEEVLERLDSLSPQDKRRLKLIELRRLSGTDFKEGLLYQEAVCQAILGERRCPREVSFVAFLAQSMRSIASHRRKELARQVPITKVDGSGSLN